jgi:hypothetical protein
LKADNKQSLHFEVNKFILPMFKVYSSAACHILQKVLFGDALHFPCATRASACLFLSID